MNKNNPEEIYKEKYTLLENLQNSFADPSLSQKILRENGYALAAEYTELLHKIIEITKRSDTTQHKLFTADLTIREQREELKQKNARLEQKISEQILLKKKLQQQADKLTIINRK
ncbi:MAG: hypothetical protein D3923_19325, partial [Candidatus Electrothrix sp. AR3]|nr:hypothetical protein [Candidatus Electrothrix sp. AR3]